MLEYINFENFNICLSILSTLLIIIGLISVKNIRDVATLIDTAKTEFIFIKEFLGKALKLKQMIVEAKKDDGVWDKEELEEMLKYVNEEFTYTTEDVTNVIQSIETGLSVVVSVMKKLAIFVKLKLKI